MPKKLSVAIIGSRGIPAQYGGFETFAERLATELVLRDHSVSVFCLKKYSTYQDRFYKGVRRILVPSIKVKALEKVTASFLSILYASFSRFNVIFLLGVSGGLFTWIPRIFGKKLVVNIDGLEWRRAKWGKFISYFLRLSEKLCSSFSHAVIADSKEIQKYYASTYRKESEYIPYGSDLNIKEKEDYKILEKYSLKEGKYILQVCRLEPENNPDIIISEFKSCNSQKSLVIVGDAPYGNTYINSLKSSADNRIQFLGGIYGPDFKVILRNAFCYVHGHEVGGTNPALLEAMASSNCVLVLDVPYNLEVIQDSGIHFSKSRGSLASKFELIESNPDLVHSYRERAMKRIQEAYIWTGIIDSYERLFLDLSAK